MRIRVRAILAFTVVLAMVALAALTIATEQPVCAKGAVKSTHGSSSDSNSKSGSSSSSKSDSGSSSSSSSSSQSSGSSSSSHSSSSNSSGSSSRSAIDSRNETRTYQSPSSSPSTNRLDQDFYLRTPSSKLDPKRPTPTYRKDYADIGDIYRSRQEKRNPNYGRDSDYRRSDDRRDSDYRRYDGRRDGFYYDRYYDRNWSVNIYHSPFRYRHYCYDYRPSYCYPSPYCFYYDYYPPYIAYDRVIVVARIGSPRIYVEAPVFIYQRDYNYYLSNREDKELWAVLGDIQRGWERSDPQMLMDHVRRNSTIEVYLKGEYTYSVDWLDYYDMTRDAMSVIKTRSFNFDKVTRRDGGLYIAHGTHTYADEYGLQKTVFIAYTFERYGNEWFITAVGSSTVPI